MDVTVRSYLIKGGVVLAIFGAGAATGRFAGPTKIQYEQKIVYQDRVVTVAATTDDKTTDKNLITTRTETTKPDGSKVVTTVTRDKSTIVDDSHGTTSTTNTVNQTTDTTETKTYNKSDWSVNVLASKNVINWSMPVGFGASVQRRILGPFSVGAFGLSDGEAGLSVGVSF